jgi:class 3 adenylate cyclase
MDATLIAPEPELAELPVLAPGAGCAITDLRSRQMAAVAFVDIVDSTHQLVRHGDRHWSAVLRDFHALGARTVTAHRGRLVKTMGDGLLATFETASDAIASLAAIRRAGRGRGLAVRGAVHVAEIELVGSDIAGVGVHVAARVESLAPPGEVWVTSTVHDVVAGSHVRLEDCGEHRLKGFDHPWRLYAVRD